MRASHTMRWIALYAAAALIGIASAWLWLTRVGISGVDAGVWRVNLLAGSVDADAHTRARIAIEALLALDRRETLYYTTTRDDADRPLQAQCAYEITLRPPAARWWSITAYGADGFLFPNAHRRYSVSGEHVVPDADGRATFHVGPSAASYPSSLWIQTSGSGPMRLTLRLYQPDAALQRSPKSLDPPHILRSGPCRT